MKRFTAFLIILFVWCSNAIARDLYKVTVTSETEAELLRVMAVEPVVPVRDGYLVLAASDVAEQLRTAKLSIQFIAADVEIDQLAADQRFDRENVKKHNLIYEEDNFRIYKLDVLAKAIPAERADLIPIENRHLKIEYHYPQLLNEKAIQSIIGLDSLISLVSQDSITSYMVRLEAFDGRLTGSDSGYAARDWVAGKFASFGYDSIVIDSFIGQQLPDRHEVFSQNVIAYKIGNKYPDRQIIIGAHYDGVPSCPASDDNGSGTAAVLEMARVLHNLETDVTFIFISFDSEESGLLGAHHYVDSAAAHGDYIIYMMSLDMIGNLGNSNSANLYYGSNSVYARLWSQISDSLVGISGTLSGTSFSSDHYPFQTQGYDVTFVQEGIFSTVYHCYDGNVDNNSHVDFSYMTRMIKGSLATAYSIGYTLPKVRITSVRDVGDGQSLQIQWTPLDPAQITHYYLYYDDNESFTHRDSVYIERDSSQCHLSGLTNGQEYWFYLVAFDDEGRSALVGEVHSGTPYLLPQPPYNVAAWPLLRAIRITWEADNTELDFSHYAIIRDEVMLPDTFYNFVYVDTAQSLGSDFHYYLVVAVDSSANISDTAGVEPVRLRAATLREGKILAVNRSDYRASSMVDAVITGNFLREGLSGLDFDYYSDTAHSYSRSVTLTDMINYELLVIGGETGRADDIGNLWGGGMFLDSLTYYLSMGGKAVIFVRWGDLSLTPKVDTIVPPYDSNHAYEGYFDITSLVYPLTHLYQQGSQYILHSDFVGAHSQAAGYPELVWDSAAAIHHTSAFIPGVAVSGIPCANYPLMAGAKSIDTIYTYNSSSDSVLTEGKLIGWRYRGSDYKYVLFGFPLTFMNWDNAKTALQQAVMDMGLSLSADDNPNPEPLPTQFTLYQNYPNPFNQGTVIEFYNPHSQPTKASVEVLNILGQRVKLVFDGMAQPGRNRIEWDGRDKAGRPVATGVYLYRFKADEITSSRKMILVK